MPGFEKKQTPVKTKTMFLNEINVEGDKHADFVFETMHVNRILK